MFTREKLFQPPQTRQINWFSFALGAESTQVKRSPLHLAVEFFHVMYSWLLANPERPYAVVHFVVGSFRLESLRQKWSLQSPWPSSITKRRSFDHRECAESGGAVDSDRRWHHTWSRPRRDNSLLSRNFHVAVFSEKERPQAEPSQWV